MEKITKKHIRYIVMTTFGISLCTVLVTLGLWGRSFSHVPEMFKLNRECQQQGFYMGEFEFKMLGLAYLLEKGEYVRAVHLLDSMYTQLKTKDGLIRVPDFKTKEEEMEFYLSLQNPDTGAFMDPSFPFCSYTGPTGNVLEHLDSLAEETGIELKLKYPLSYLDELNTPEKMKAYLDDVSRMGWIGNKFPQTTFHNARDLLSLFYEENTLEKWDLYPATPEMKMALLEWFYENQDPETGLWGPMDKNGRPLRKDTMNTASVMKAFVDENGNNRHSEFPLHYRNELAHSFLSTLRPLPEDDAYDMWHEWNLDTGKSLRSLTRYLWQGLSDEIKMKTREEIEKYIYIKFTKFYIREEGAFSYYPDSHHATLDGTGFIGNLNNFGYCSTEKRIYLWGPGRQTCTDKGSIFVENFTGIDEDFRKGKINSIRLYTANPENEDFTKGVWAIYYPRQTNVPDAMELMPEVHKWLEETPQSMGNWTSRESLLKEAASYCTEYIPAYNEQLPLGKMNEMLQNRGELTVVGFDMLQVPVVRATYRIKNQVVTYNNNN